MEAQENNEKWLLYYYSVSVYLSMGRFRDAEGEQKSEDDGFIIFVHMVKEIA